MLSKYIKLDDEALQQVVNTLVDGRVVVFPTENTYGLLANADDEKAVEAIYTLKKRDKKKPLGYLSNKDKAKEVCIVDGNAQKVLDVWPTSISIIMPKRESVPDYITSGYPSLLLVCPDKISEKLVSLCPVPIACTSANLSSEPAIVDFNTAKRIFSGKVPLIVDGQESLKKANGTIIDFSKPTPTVLRIGPFPIDRLKHMIPNLIVSKTLI